MGKLYCMMGKSSTGKDTIYRMVLHDARLHLKPIIPYTTRPIRAGEVDGESYHFCSEAKKQELLAAKKVIELRSYDTMHGLWEYFTVDDGSFDLSRENYLMIGTIASYTKLCDYFDKSVVLPIYIEVEDGIRLQRALSREMQQSHPKYEEMCRRFLADSNDFSEEALREAHITRRFVNDDAEQTKEKIVSYIMETM